jgi:pimeloyl-ACP methyl ester carboxylesterase
MSASMLLLVSLVGAVPVETRFAQVSPTYREEAWQRSRDCKRAVILIHGFRPHPFSSQNVLKPEWRSWQKPEAGLVKELGKASDVYAFAYSQNQAVERIAGSAALGKNIERLKKLDYSEIVLVGHSAGGLIARQFAEDHPDAGVTKVIQTSTPNAGTTMAKAAFSVRKSQKAFIESLTPERRRQVLTERAAARIPETVEFVCVVCQLDTDRATCLAARLGKAVEVELHLFSDRPGDGVVCCDSQWSEDLRCQGIPAVLLHCMHSGVVRSRIGEEKIAELIREKQPRWDSEKVAAEKPKILKGS